MAAKIHDTDALVRLSRRNLWFALVMILLLGITGVLASGVIESRAATAAAKVWILLPLVISIGVIALKTAAKGAFANPIDPALTAVMSDELRQASLQRAYRNGFMGILILQPLLVLLLPWTSVVYPSAVMACATVTAGAVIVLGSLLYYDR
jgi:hypothetical protein